MYKGTALVGGIIERPEIGVDAAVSFAESSGVGKVVG